MITEEPVEANHFERSGFDAEMIPKGPRKV